MVLESFQNILAAAGACASRLGHSEVTVTHVTYVLCTTGALNAAFRKLGKDVKSFEEAILETMTTSDDFTSSADGGLRVSHGLARCIGRAEKAATDFGREAFTNDDFLVEALQNEHGTPADDCARKAFLLFSGRVGNDQGKSETVPTASAADDGSQDQAVAPSTQPNPGQQALALWANDLVAAARRGELDEVFGRDMQIERLCKILARRKKSNPILVGEPGVGKTAVVEGLAVLIASGRASTFLADKRIHALDIKGILAGTRNRGDLEERFKFILEAAAADPDVILFIDEIHTVVGAGGAMAGVADLMKPALASGKIRCIGATTYDEFARYFSGDPAMVRRFQEVSVEEPTRDEALNIVRMAAGAYELHHGVSYSDDALVAAVDLSIRHLADRQLPDKALDIIDEAGASMRSREGACAVSETDVLRVVRDMSRDRFVGADEDEVWMRLASDMESKVAGRNNLIAELVRFLRGVSSHPAARQGAKARFLFSGPAGAGKRHIAEALAESLEVPLLVLDMASYADRSAVSSLIGAPPGYIGYDDGGKLTEFVRRNPAGVILVDRIDAAHDAARDVISAAMSAGQMSDARGRKVSFRNSVIIVTKERRQEIGSIGFRGRTSDDAETGVAGMNFDRVFQIPLLDAQGASAFLAARFDAVATSYQAAGTRFDVESNVIPLLVDAGQALGGRAGDYAAAYVELFEAKLFKTMLPRRGTITASVSDGCVNVEVSSELAS